MNISYRIGSRTRRRWLVVIMYAGYVVAGLTISVVLFRVMQGGQHRVLNLVVLVLLPVVILASMVSRSLLSGRKWINSPSFPQDRFDERQRELRNDAIQRAYPTIRTAVVWCSTLSVLALEGSQVARWAMPWPFIGLIVLTMSLLGTALLASTLPTAILAWNEPDPIINDESEST
jgi:hypothetical protein